MPAKPSSKTSSFVIISLYYQLRLNVFCRSPNKKSSASKSDEKVAKWVPFYC